MQYCTSVCIKKPHVKIHSDRTINMFCSVQQGFLKLRVKIPFWSMVFLRKFPNKEIIFRQATI